MKLVLPTQIPLCGKRPPALGALTEAMKTHQRPFVLIMSENDRHELVSTINMMAERLMLVPCILDAYDTSSLNQHLCEKERTLLVVVESTRSRLPRDVQTLILERYMPRPNNDKEIQRRIRAGAKADEIRDVMPKAHPPAGMLVITDTDPGILCSDGIWSIDFTTLKQFTVAWDPMTRRPDAYGDVFKAGLTIAARAEKIQLNGRVDDEAVRRYDRMQKILASHARKATERGMNLKAHESVSEILAAARDCIRYIGHKADRRVNNDVIEALVFKGVTELALKTTFGLAVPKARKSRPSFGPDAPYQSTAKTAVGE